ncbi:MAG: efflux RND transporter periplasmic adaptor subunit [Polyangiales bacterium]
MGRVEAWALVVSLGACGREAPHASAGHSPPATVANRVAESELTTVTLTEEAAGRLGIETERTVEGEVPSAREVGGELVAVPGRAVVLSAPVAGRVQGSALRAGAAVRRGEILARLVPLAPADRDLRAQAAQQVAAAQARLDAAEARAARAAQLAQDRAGSVRASEEAVAERDTARAALTAARARRARLSATPLDSDVSLTLRAPADGVVRQVLVADGQSVAGGAALVEVASLASLWVRVPLYAGDVARLDPAAPASVRALSGSARFTAAPVEGPPTADAVAATTDRYYALENADGAWRPGERVMVQLRERATERATTAPWSAVVYDAYGGAWVYEALAPQRFVRRRVEVERVVGDRAVFTQGLAAGVTVVRVGAAELFGTEFGAGH